MEAFWNAVLTALLPIVLTAIGLLGSIALAYLRKLLKRLEEKAGVEIDAERRVALETAISNAFNQFGSDPQSIAMYLRKFNAGVLAAFGLDRDELALMTRIQAGIATRSGHAEQEPRPRARPEE